MGSRVGPGFAICRPRVGLIAVAAALAFAAGACSSSADDDPAAAGSTSATAEPTTSPSPDPPITASSSPAPNASDLAGVIAEDDQKIPAGWRKNTVLVAAGYGSFTLATPQSFLLWRPGVPADIDAVIAEASARDPFWNDFWEPRLREAASDSSLRALLIDTNAPEGSVVAFELNLTIDGGDPGSPAAVTERFATGYTDGGLEVVDQGTRAWQDSQLGFVEYEVASSQMGGGSPRRILQAFYPDRDQELLWSVSCDVPAPDRDRHVELCTQAQDTFLSRPRQ